MIGPLKFDRVADEFFAFRAAFNYSVPVTLAISRTDTMAISSVPWM
jgi:hypothetical protein